MSDGDLLVGWGRFSEVFDAPRLRCSGRGAPPNHDFFGRRG